jgi:hypothetical protein
MTFGIVAGLAFGTLAATMMIPMTFPDKTAAISAAFIDRFAIGFLIPLTTFAGPGALRGAIIGLLLSLPSAIITKGYVPILVLGTLGGAIIGWLA